MEYDPLKNRLAKAINMFPALRKFVYIAFNIIFLRQRYVPVSYTHLRAHETPEHLVCRLLLEKKKTTYLHLLIIQAHLKYFHLIYCPDK